MQKIKTIKRPIMKALISRGNNQDEIKLICEIRKGSGSSAFITDGEQRMPLNDAGIKFIVQKSSEAGRLSRIKLNGLSRAQISRIATDLAEQTPGKVFLNGTIAKYGATKVSDLPRYDIVIMN